MNQRRLWHATVRIAGCVVACLIFHAGFASAGPWKQLEEGLEFATFKADLAPPVGDSTITVLRIDPNLWELRVLSESASPISQPHTARGWCDELGLVAAINAGMFQGDGATHVGYMRTASHTNCGKWNDYMSAAAFGPRRNGLPGFRMFDLDTSAKDSIAAQYDNVIQNLRLIKRPGENRWSQQEKRWSEAALGEDSAGRILFVFCRSPYTMHDLNHILLELPIDLVAAQHLEGGPEAQMVVRAGDVDLELVGSFETDFRESDSNTRAWHIPNLIGVRRRPSVGQ